MVLTVFLQARRGQTARREYQVLLVPREQQVLPAHREQQVLPGLREPPAALAHALRPA